MWYCVFFFAIEKNFQEIINIPDRGEMAELAIWVVCSKKLLNKMPAHLL